VAVMYAGRVVEYTDVFTLFGEPAHPYTKALLRSLPRLGAKRNRLDSIEGLPPQLNRLPPGCAFEPRCKYSTDLCKEKAPELTRLDEGHYVRCYYPINAG
jgi:oligopeptide/dipeptide ABC transporter ATP-binding protein